MSCFLCLLDLLSHNTSILHIHMFLCWSGRTRALRKQIRGPPFRRHARLWKSQSLTQYCTYWREGVAKKKKKSPPSTFFFFQSLYFVYITLHYHSQPFLEKLLRAKKSLSMYCTYDKVILYSFLVCGAWKVFWRWS